jgi:hypothetical protein
MTTLYLAGAKFMFCVITYCTIADIVGIIMYLSPIDLFPPGMREVAMLDSYNHIVFLHIFE